MEKKKEENANKTKPKFISSAAETID